MAYLMGTAHTTHDVIVVGAGFYGCVIATRLKELGVGRVCVLERGPAAMCRASLVNQARIHQGYHYPRDFTTAYRSSQSFKRFIARYRDAVFDDFTQVYAIASRGSQVSARQFLSMMRAVGAPVSGASRRHASLFSPRLIEAVFETKEFAFDAVQLSGMVMREATAHGVEFMFGTEALSCTTDGQVTCVSTSAGDLSAPHVINCTYGRLHMLHPTPLSRRLKYELCEMCLVQPPPVIEKVGITVMDGPFFSCMPYPSRGLHSLSHVSHTPQASWVAQDDVLRDPYEQLRAMPDETAFLAMREDAARFVPSLSELSFQGSLSEVKAVLESREADDGRPILVEGNMSGGVVSILGGKLDNVFDVLEIVDAAFATPAGNKE